MGSAIEPSKTQMPNPTIALDRSTLSLGENAVWRNYFPFAIVSRPGDFFAISISKINSYPSIIF
jgi:hypothetical protein